jgi:hypothetical protein
MKFNLTKKEIRHAFNNDPVLVWFKETLNERFSYEAELLGATSAERLFEIRGQAKILRFFNDIDTLLEYVDMEETDD